jgi:hypothetical protein
VDTGSVVGVVQDSIGAAIAGGQVTLTNQDTGQVATAKTNTSGEYTFSPVRIGTYTVSVEYPGFEKAVYSNVVVTVQSHVLVDITLQPGRQNQTVTVTAGAPLLQAQDASVGQVVQENATVDGNNDQREIQFALKVYF